MKRKFFECTKEGLQEFEKENPGCKMVLTVIKKDKIYISNGDNLTEEERKELEVRFYFKK